MTNKALMFDCETLDVRPTAAILSVGIVEIDFDKGKLGKEFYLQIDADDCIRRGATVSVDTLHWWTTQDVEFVRAALKPKKPGSTLVSDDKDFWNPVSMAVPKILNFVEQFPDDIEVWSCGGRDFDWLEHLIDLGNLEGSRVPWDYRQIRDYRTLKKLFPSCKPPVPNDEPHNALADARYQAQHLIELKRFVTSIPSTTGYPEYTDI